MSWKFGWCWFRWTHQERQVHSNTREGNSSSRWEHWHHWEASGEHQRGEHRVEPPGPPRASLHLSQCPPTPLWCHPLRRNTLPEDCWWQAFCWCPPWKQRSSRHNISTLVIFSYKLSLKIYIKISCLN